MNRKLDGTATEKDPRWGAIVRRDPKSDGIFYYSVKTTGVYCRPSCAARLARPENVEFYATGADAQRAGFRPCKRCKPEQPSLLEQHATRIAEVCRLIESSDSVPSLDALARAAELSAYHFHRVFKSVTGLTPKGYADAHRAKRVRGELSRGKSVTDAMYDGGFNSSGRFYEKSNDMLGMTPRAFRAGGASQVIRFAIGQCTLGAILVAQSERGICAILMGDDPDALVRDLEDRFPRADLIGGDPAFEQIISQVVGFVETPKVGLELPLDVQGTAFQQRVWNALRKIPAGKTATYSEVAQAIGAPNAVRAVASACAANKLAVAIPCHRVIRNDGSLSGYRWGVERKQALLKSEASQGKAKRL